MQNYKKFPNVFLFQKKCIFAAANRTGCGAVGSALRSGRRGRKFESSHPDFSLGLSQCGSPVLYKFMYLCRQILKI